MEAGRSWYWRGANRPEVVAARTAAHRWRGCGRRRRRRLRPGWSRLCGERSACPAGGEQHGNGDHDDRPHLSPTCRRSSATTRRPRASASPEPGSTASSAARVFTDGYGVYSDGPFAINAIGPVPPVDGTAWIAGDIMCSTRLLALDLHRQWHTGDLAEARRGAATAGAFHPIDPTRVFDSRLADGRIASGGDLVVSVKDGHDLTTGAVTVADLVPAGATAIAFNLVAAATAAAGFIAITPGDAATFAASTINWGSPTTVANGGSSSSTAPVRSSSSSAVPVRRPDAIIDVTGYYR